MVLMAREYGWDLQEFKDYSRKWPSIIMSHLLHFSQCNLSPLSLSFIGIICATQNLHVSINQFQVLKILKMSPD